MSELGRELKDRRLLAGLTQEELAERATISVRSLRDLESGKVARPRARSVRLIASALSLDDTATQHLLSLSTAAQLGAGRAQTTPRLAQLPAAPSHFVGRAQIQERLDQLLVGDGGQARLAVISSIGGAGKTALALHWAHRLTERFPDGQLYLNLRAHASGQEAVTPSDALDSILSALGTDPSEVPHTLEDKAALYRSRVASSRVLIILDNAADADQVRPLLPGTNKCFVLVTSRKRLPGLVIRDGAMTLQLEMLATDEAVELYERIVGYERAHADSAALDRVVDLCGHLPLALRIVAADLAMSPERTMADIADELTQGDRLDYLDVQDDPASSVRVAFDLSYRRLPTELRILFRRLSLIPGDDFTPGLVASLMARDPAEIERQLGGLVSLNLLQSGNNHRYSFHDLLRLYAQMKSACDDDTFPALERMFSYYLQNAEAANLKIRPTRLRTQTDPQIDGTILERFDTYGAAFGWCEAELINLSLATEAAAATGFDRVAAQIPTSLIDFLIRNSSFPVWIKMHEAGLRSARRLGDARREGILLRDLGLAYVDLNQLDKAQEHFLRSIQLARADTDRMPLARSLSSMGVSLYYQKKDTEALTYYNEALSIADEVGDSYGALINVINAGFSHVNLGNNELAMEMFESAHSRAVTLDEKQAQGVSMGGIAHLLRLRGDLDEALSKFEGCLALTIEIKNTTGEIEARHYLGLTHQDLGNKAAAREQFEVALRIAEEYGDRRIEELRGRLAHLEDRRG